MQQIKPLNVCKYLRDSIKRQKPISIYCSQGSIWKGYAPVGERLKGRALESSYKTLGDLFQGNHPSTSESQRRKYLELSNRRRLQCLLAQSLLHLYQSPWLPDVWDLDSVIFAHEQSSFSIKEPHSPCDLCLPSSSEQDNPKDPHIEPDMRTFMIKFGFLLLQIERQQRLELSEEEKLEDFGHDIALHRYLKELSGSVEEPFQKVLRSCLDFDECVDQIKLSISDDLKCRLAIFKLILAPLMEILAFSFPNVAAEISPMQAQEAPRNATVESVGHGLVDPTGRNQSTQDSQLQSTQGKLKQSSGGRGQVLATNTHRTAAIKSRESDSVDSWHEPECREEDDVSSDAESPLSGEAGNLFAVFDAYTSGSK